MLNLNELFQKNFLVSGLKAFHYQKSFYSLLSILVQNYLMRHSENNFVFLCE